MRALAFIRFFAPCFVLYPCQQIKDTIESGALAPLNFLYYPRFAAALTSADCHIADCVLRRADSMRTRDLSPVDCSDDKRDREEDNLKNPKPPTDKQPIRTAVSSLCGDNSSAACYAAPLLLMRYDVDVFASTIRANHIMSSENL